MDLCFFILTFCLFLQIGLATQLDDCLNPSYWNTPYIHKSLNGDGKWGTYLPNAYFALKTKNFPRSYVYSIAWGIPEQRKVRFDMGMDEVSEVYWEFHDGRRLGKEVIVDNELATTLTHTFSTADDDKGWQATSHVKNGKEVVVWLVVGVDCDGMMNQTMCLDANQPILSNIQSSSSSLTMDFSFLHSSQPPHTLKIGLGGCGDHIPSISFLSLSDMTHLKDELIQTYNQGEMEEEEESMNPTTHNFMAIELNLPNPPTSNDPVNECTITSSLIPPSGEEGDKMDEEVLEETFIENLCSSPFKICSLNTNKKEMIGTRALSDLLGGMGYFFGYPYLKSPPPISPNSFSPPPQPSFPLPLFSATPSRVVFPRGFIWDEGFHQLTIHHFDPSISLEVFSHYLYGMHGYSGPPSPTNQLCSSGWIPREIILGAHSLSKVPREFIPQEVGVANPPTFFLLLSSFLNHYPSNPAFMGFMEEHWREIEVWGNWFLSTQAGPTKGSMGWQGRDTSNSKLHPNTLPSGLDDYPRSERVDPSSEKHVDCLSWGIMVAKTLGRIHKEVFGNEEKGKKYSELEDEMMEVLMSEHWNGGIGGFLDIGPHEEEGEFRQEVDVLCVGDGMRGRATIKGDYEEVLRMKGGKRLERDELRKFEGCPSSTPYFGAIGAEIKPIFKPTNTNYEVKQVPRIGYVTIFPLLLQLLEPDDPKLVSLLDLVESHLLSRHGLTSLSSSDKYYQRENGPGDAPYWRGPIWMPINYLALSSLHHYASTPSPIQSRSSSLYSSLRSSLLNTVSSSHTSTGYFWEQYDDKSGEGRRGHPFTGWTSLYLNILKEIYH